jgi:hypothetical protein
MAYPCTGGGEESAAGAGAPPVSPGGGSPGRGHILEAGRGGCWLARRLHGGAEWEVAAMAARWTELERELAGGGGRLRVVLGLALDAAPAGSQAP